MSASAGAGTGTGGGDSRRGQGAARPLGGAGADADAADRVGEVFAALADPTRRLMVQELLRDGTTSVPTLAAQLPISRQAVAKHMAALDRAGLVERAPARGREVRYRLRERALSPAAAWMRDAEGAWEERLGRLKRAVEAGAR